jgi:hypothetical protein
VFKIDPASLSYDEFAQLAGEAKWISDTYLKKEE